MKSITLHSHVCMSNSGYHRCGKPNWWARIGQGDSAQFCKMKSVRGDEFLLIEVEVPDDTSQVFIGAGKGKDGVRETINV
jgi:hypothetical protein